MFSVKFAIWPTWIPFLRGSQKEEKTMCQEVKLSHLVFVPPMEEDKDKKMSQEMDMSHKDVQVRYVGVLYFPEKKRKR